MRETRRALVVLVRSPGGIFSPRSIAYNRPKHGGKKTPVNQEIKTRKAWKKIKAKNYSSMRQEVHASAIRRLAGGRAEGASPARCRWPYRSG